MKLTILSATLILATSFAWGETLNVSCKNKRSEYRLQMTAGSPSKLFYKGQASFGYTYQLEEIEVDGNLSCVMKNTSPLIVDCQSENEYVVLGRATGPEGEKQKLKAGFKAVSRTVIDETVAGKETKVSNILNYRVMVGFTDQVSPLKVKGTKLEAAGEQVFQLDLGQGLQDTVECSVL